MVGNGLVAHDIYDGSRHCSWVRLLCFPVQFGYTKYRQDSSSNLSSISHQRKAPTVFWMSHVSLNFGLSLSCPSWTRPRCKLFVKDPHDNVVHASTPLLACHNHHLVKSMEIKSAGKIRKVPISTSQWTRHTRSHSKASLQRVSLNIVEIPTVVNGTANDNTCIHLPLELAAVLFLEFSISDFWLHEPPMRQMHTNKGQFRSPPWEEKQVAQEVKAVDLEQVWPYWSVDHVPLVAIRFGLNWAAWAAWSNPWTSRNWNLFSHRDHEDFETTKK